MDGMSSGQITELTVFHLKAGLHLRDVTRNRADAAVQAFLRLTTTIKTQNGFLQQFWGHQVETPHLFVWAINWTSVEHQAAFKTSVAHEAFNSTLGKIFDIEVDVPIKVFIHVSDTQGLTNAFRSTVTEVSFFAMATQPSPSAKSDMEKGLEPVLEQVQSVGKSTGATIGWVFDAVPSDRVFGEEAVCLFGLFGYQSIEAHMQWRDTPECRKIRGVDDPPQKKEDQMWPATSIPGIPANPDASYFHVVFCEGGD